MEAGRELVLAHGHSCGARGSLHTWGSPLSLRAAHLPEREDEQGQEQEPS